MLGRLVAAAIERHGPDYPLGPIAAQLGGAGLAIVNLECAITTSRCKWRGAPKAFYFGAPPQAVQSLLAAGIGLVSLANNHTLDFDLQGLRETLGTLDAHRVAHAGAGEDLPAALRPAIVERQGVVFGMAAFCDHQPDFAAQTGQPGIAWLDLDKEPAALAILEAALARVLEAGAHWPILSLHWGPNMVSHPSLRFRRIARAAIDMGWKIVFGHSAHVFQGVEWRRGCPIIYAAGDLVDDYHVDPALRNDHQLLFELELDHHAVRRLVMTPLFIANCQVGPANAAQRGWIHARMTRLCRELGTSVAAEGDLLAALPP
jgi:poly-gamma-glutamate capsule biosynthesis protein CapA/YwtB (metallophosphatase superfamily)